MPIKSATVQITPVQSGSGDPSPTNVRPITGWTGANVTRTGINVWDEQSEVGSLNTATGANASDNTKIRSKNYIPVVGGESYRFVAPEGFVLCGYDASQNYIGEITRADSVFTLPANCAFVRFRMATQYGATYNHDISINYPSSDTSYHAYSGTTINVNWSDSAGTIYKGTLTYNGDGTWTPTDTHAIEDLGNRDWTYTTTAGHEYFNSNTLSEIASNTTDMLCSIYTAASFSDVYNHVTDNIISTTGSKLQVYSTVAGSDVDAFKTAVTGQKLIYELATPIVGTPITTEELVTLLGNNNVWADCGDTSVEYPADTKLYIDKQVANLMAVISSL